MSMARVCPVCNGSGVVRGDSLGGADKHKCWWCKGQGEVV